MKRPMLLCGCAALGLSLISIAAPPKVLFCLAALIAAAVVTLCVLKRASLFSWLSVLLILFALSARCAAETERVQTAKAMDKNTTVTGVVTAVSYNDNSAVYTVASDGVKINLVSVGGYGLKDGQKITAQVRMLSKGEYSDFKGGAHATAYLLRLQSAEDTSSLYAWLHTLRNGIKNLFYDTLFGDEAAMLLGLTIGEKDYISEGLSQNVRRASASHIMVVSGLHLGIIVGTFLKFTRRFCMDRFIVGVLGIVIILFLIALTGFTASVIRSGVAYLIILFGLLVRRKPDALNSFFAAIAINVFINPLVILSVSFQLSAAATFGVLVIAPSIDGIIMKRAGNTALDKIAGAISSIVSVALGATLATLPFTLWHFSTFSLVSMATNLLVTHLVTGALVLSVLATACAALPQISTFILLISGTLSRVIIFLLNSLGGLPFAEIHTKAPKLLAVVAFCFVSVLTYYFIKFQKRSDTYGDRPGT